VDRGVDLFYYIFRFWEAKMLSASSLATEEPEITAKEPFSEDTARGPDVLAEAFDFVTRHVLDRDSILFEG
jgi:hypothetical protein